MSSPKQLDQDRRTLDLILDTARGGHTVVILDSEREALERIHTFLAGPSVREIDAIVDKHRLNQHDVERTVREIFGDRKP